MLKTLWLVHSPYRLVPALVQTAQSAFKAPYSPPAAEKLVHVACFVGFVLAYGHRVNLWAPMYWGGLYSWQRQVRLMANHAPATHPRTTQPAACDDD